MDITEVTELIKDKLVKLEDELKKTWTPMLRWSMMLPIMYFRAEEKGYAPYLCFWLHSSLGIMAAGM